MRVYRSAADHGGPLPAEKSVLPKPDRSTAGSPMLCLHLKNGTRVETPASTEEFQCPRHVLMSAYPTNAIAHVKG